MNSPRGDQKSLVLGILVGIIVSLLVFLGGIFIWEQLSCKELKVAANQLTSIIIEGTRFDFMYRPASGLVHVQHAQSDGLSEEDDFPANVGFTGSWSCWTYTVTEVNPDYVVLFFKPIKFITVNH